jgi:putative ABC transport system substrate-binding protein
MMKPTTTLAPIALLALALLAVPLAAEAQTAMPVIGFLSSRSATDSAPDVAAFRAGLREAGYAERQNVAIDYRWADGQYNRLPALAADLARRHVAVIFSGGPPAALAAKAATTSIPIVFVSGYDPIESRLVASLGRPGGNVTGISIFTGQLGAKQLGLLRELVPSVTAVAMLVNPSNPVSKLLTTDVRAAAATTGHRIHVVSASSESDLGKAFATIANLHTGALIVGADPFFFSRKEQIAALVARIEIPAIYELREYAAVGGLMSYGASIRDGYRQGGIYTGRVLKGEKPADLPVMQPTKFELVINLKAAKALGLTIPQSVLLQADEVIE